MTSAVAVVLIVALAGALGLSAGPADRAAAQSSPPCELVLGFRAFHDELGADITGECIENQQSTRAGAAQRTTRGLLEWEAATNRVSFTDGYYTWASGPRGIEQRLNSELFDWEQAAAAMSAAPVAAPTAPLVAGARAVEQPAVWLAVGQSNMENVSAGWSTEARAAQVVVRRHNYQATNNDLTNWTSLSQLGTFPGVAGTFGMELAARLGAGPVYVQANAVTATAISCWTPSAPCYENQVRAFIPGIKGIIWWQGEADGADPLAAPTYEAHLRRVFGAFRQDAGRPTLPIVMIGLQTYCSNWVGDVPQATCTEPSGWSQVRTAQRAVAAQDPCIALIDAQPWTRGELHPTTFYAQAGALLAEAAVRLAYGGTSGCG